MADEIGADEIGKLDEIETHACRTASHCNCANDATDVLQLELGGSSLPLPA